MTGQNCSAVCTNEGGHRVAFSSEWHEAPRVLRGLLEPRAKREARSVLCHSLMVDSTFEQSKNVAITPCYVVYIIYDYTVSSSSCSWHAVRGVAYAIIAQVQSLVLRSSAHAHCTYWQSWLYMYWTLMHAYTLDTSHIIPWLWHQTYLLNIKGY